jgi:hypothetical protein
LSARLARAALGALARGWSGVVARGWLARAGFVLVAAAAAGWDLPSSFSWENDGVAPRDLFAGVAENLIPGHAFRYPLLHPLLTGLLCLPVLVPAALRAPSFHLGDLRAAILAPPVMTACALIGRGVAVAAAVVALAALGRVAKRLHGARAGRWAEAFAAVNLSFAYYGRATNLDGPALMWSVLAIERLLLATAPAPTASWSASPRRRDHLWFAAFAAASVATKDQAYAVYALVVPFLIAVRWRRPEAFARGAWSGRRVAAAAGVGVLVYLAASGALFNPTGWVTRLRTLAGPASGDYREYARDWYGLAANLHDVAARQADFWWPWPVVALAWAGVLAALFAAPASPLVAVPLLAGLGSLVAFTLVAGRAEHRFVLPLGFWLSLYAGVGLEAARARLRRRRSGARAAVLADVVGAALVAAGLLVSLRLVATQWRDGRRAVEAALRALPPGTTVETYGPLVYQPRFAPRGEAPYRVARVGGDPAAARNPLAGMDEREDAVTADGVARRRPGVIVVTEGFATPYLAGARSGGRVFAPLWEKQRSDAATAPFVRDAVAGRLPGYRLSLVAAPDLPFAPVRVHESTGMRTWVLVRAD